MEKNRLVVEMESLSENESLARMIAGAFLIPFQPTVEEMEDVKTAVSEAVTNCVIHGYEQKQGIITLVLQKEGQDLIVEVIDQGVGISQVERAMEPMYTTKPHMERSGLGFTFMEAFMDEIKVESEVDKGTTIRMRKKITVTPAKE